MKNDGQVALVELTLGSLLFFSFGVFLIGWQLPMDSGLPIRFFLGPGMLILAGVAISAALRVVILMGEEVVIPRSRTTEIYPPHVLTRRGQLWLKTLCMIFVVLAAFAIEFYFKQSRSLLLFFFVMFLSICYTLLGAVGFQWRRPRVWHPELFGLGALLAIFGVWEYLQNGGLGDYQWFLLWLGATTLGAGALRLLSFLKSHPRTAS